MARTFRHWSPRYIVNRLLLSYHQRANPDAPWLTRQACDFLDEWLRPTDVGVEWGSGRSTLWIAKRVGGLKSIEHDQNWYTRIKDSLQRANLTNVDYNYAPIDAAGPELPPYVEAGADFEPETLDFAVVDGKLREECLTVAMPRLKPGGYLILDNAEKYLAHATNAPAAVVKQAEAATPVADEMAAELAEWRCYWTSDGVCDTAIFAKPQARAA